MGVCVIAGGVGSGRFCAGLVRVVDPAELTIVVNIGDDERIRGLHISPDIDAVLYHLAGETDWDRGWGASDETFRSDDRYRELAERAGDAGLDLQEWFRLGDRDLAVHQLRTRLLEAGRTLTESTDVLRRSLGIEALVLPVSNDEVRTKFAMADGEELDFQTYFVRRHHTDVVAAINVVGSERARPAPGVIEAIAGAEVVVIPPSNPLISIDPVLAVPGIRAAIENTDARSVALSPIVGGKALKGPADRLLAELGHEVSPVGVARFYTGLVDAFVLDEQDGDRAAGIEELGMRPVVLDTIMTGPEAAARLAKEVLDAL